MPSSFNMAQIHLRGALQLVDSAPPNLEFNSPTIGSAQKKGQGERINQPWMSHLGWLQARSDSEEVLSNAGLPLASCSSNRHRIPMSTVLPLMWGNAS